MRKLPNCTATNKELRGGAITPRKLSIFRLQSCDRRLTCDTSLWQEDAEDEGVGAAEVVVEDEVVVQKMTTLMPRCRLPWVCAVSGRDQLT